MFVCCLGSLETSFLSFSKLATLALEPSGTTAGTHLIDSNEMFENEPIHQGVDTLATCVQNAQQFYNYGTVGILKGLSKNGPILPKMEKRPGSPPACDFNPKS